MKFTHASKPRASAQRGYSLVELSVALAIVAVILVGSLMGVRQILLSNMVNNQVRDSSATINKVKRLYTRQASTTGATTFTMAGQGVWPADRTTISATTATVRGVITGSNEYMFANTANLGTMNAGSGFIYTLNNVQASACAEVVTLLNDLIFAAYVGAPLVAAPTSGATPATTVAKAADGALNMANLGTGCAKATGDGVSIALVFRIDS